MTVGTATIANESLPFRDGAFDLITAAGSLNYADPAAAFPELRRVLTDVEVLVLESFDKRRDGVFGAGTNPP